MGVNGVTELKGGPESASVYLEDIDISDELRIRPISSPNRKGEIAALYDLAGWRQDSSIFLKRLSNLAIDLCNADSAGVSLIESSPTGCFFRWHGLAGELERYTGGTTPRNWSPCGECLKARRATLYSYPERHFTYLAEVEQPIVEGLVIPMFFAGAPVGTIWIVLHTASRRFDAEHVRVMTSIGGFATSALQRWCDPAGDHNHETASISGKPARDREIVWAELMERVSRRDELAFETLFQETYALVFASVLRVVSFPADAEEITADVYARVWTMASAFDSRRGSAGGWLVTIARRGAIDRLRSRAARSRSEEVFSFHAGRGDVDRSPSLAFERERSIKDALQGLPVDQRRVIELFYLSELSIKEIAAKLGQPIGTVKTRIRMGRSALRAMLASLATYSAGIQ